jgi:putative SOS response-associated peptidase YedK
MDVAPTQEVPICSVVDGRREIALARWGLVPAWSKDLTIGAKCINARTGTVADRPAFRSAFRRHRCLISADGFYEWKQLEDGSKQLYRLCLADRRPFSFAGLWQRNDRLDVTKLQHHRHRPTATSAPPIASTSPSSAPW